jgi:hypothetical protein
MPLVKLALVEEAPQVEDFHQEPPQATVRQVVRTEKVHVSHYTPWTGGTNCARFVNGQCVSKMASGQPWQEYIDQAAACPKEWDFWTRFRLPDGREFVCLDRGGAIRYGYTPRHMQYTGLAWIDLLTSSPGYKFGAVIDIEFLE